MKRTRIKICGLTREVEIQWASALGVDSIGLVFYPNSPRAVNIAQATRLMAEVAPFVTVTGLFMDAGYDEVAAVLEALDIDLLQFHGNEDADFCNRFSRPYIKAVPMGGEKGIGIKTVAAYVADHPQARGFLLDSNSVGKAGGSGKIFDWQKVPTIEKPTILAGGINTQNVAQAISTVQPYAIDVSSGVEKQRGVKDHTLMQKLVEEVRIVDQKHNER